MAERSTRIGQEHRAELCAARLMERVRNRPAALVALKDERALGHLVASVRRCAGVCLRQTKAARAVRGPQGRMSRLRGAKVLAAARSENGSPRTARPRALQALAGHSEITAELSRGLMMGRPHRPSSLSRGKMEKKNRKCFASSLRMDAVVHSGGDAASGIAESR